MSGIEKTSGTVRRQTPIGGAQTPPRQATEAFNPTKVMIDRQILREQVEDSFTAAIREAQDGDSDEAIARRTSVGSDDAERSNNRAVEARVPSGRNPNPKDQSESEQEDPDTRVSQKAEATSPAQRARSVGATSVAPQKSDIARSHNELMLISTTMNRDQTASHVAHAAARKVQAVLEGDLWTRDVSRNKRLKFEQILKVS
jgi:hypothetical protein